MCDVSGVRTGVSFSGSVARGTAGERSGWSRPSTAQPLTLTLADSAVRVTRDCSAAAAAAAAASAHHKRERHTQRTGRVRSSSSQHTLLKLVLESCELFLTVTTAQQLVSDGSNL